MRLRRMSLCVLTVLAFLGQVALANNLDPWTTVGSAGTVDEADAAIVSLSAGVAAVASTASPPATLDMRYNVVAVDGLLQTAGDAMALTARFLDNGAAARVVLRLREYSLTTGVTTTRITLDSNAFPASSAYQVRSANSTCFSGNFFDFNRNAYYVEAQIQKTGLTGSAGLAIVQVGYTLC